MIFRPSAPRALSSIEPFRPAHAMIPILYEDNHCLAVDKPAGLLSQGDATGDPSVVDLARDYLRERYAKPGNVFVGLTHRLDRPTSGVLLLARTTKGASRIAQQFREGIAAKTYLALAEGEWPEDEGEWEDALFKDERTNFVTSVEPGTAGSRHAGVAYRVKRRMNGRILLELKPTTGRGHQLRAQLASRGLSIVGDAKYGAQSRLIALDGRPRIALHASELRIKHPTRPDDLTLVSPLPADWPAG